MASLDVCFERERSWLVNGPRLADGGVSREIRPASPDGRCAGPPIPFGTVELPPDVLFSATLWRAAPTALVVEGDRLVEGSWTRCRDPLRISPAALEQPDPAACMRRMIADDPRALLPVCGCSSGLVLALAALLARRRGSPSTFGLGRRPDALPGWAPGRDGDGASAPAVRGLG